MCGYMWAATHGFDITNNSYFIDPWEFNCRNDVRQRPIWTAVQRALRFSNNQGVLTVASAGNDQFDLSAVAGIDDIGDLTIIDNGATVTVNYGAGSFTITNLADPAQLDAADFIFN